MKTAALVLVLTLLALVSSSPAKAATDVMPDLTVARVETPSIEQAGGQTRLRFTSILLNVGEGPFELRGQRANSGQPEMTVTQRIRDTDGGTRVVPTPAVMYFAGDGHTHWHVRDLATYELFTPDGEKVRVGAKHGFCFFDNYTYRMWETGVPQTAQYRHCGAQSDLQVTVGMSRMWGDVYEDTLPDQWIDITGLPAGTYRLVSTIDQSNWFQESDESNNSNWADVTISANGQVSFIAYGPGPTLWLDSPLDGASVSDSTPLFSGRASAGATVSVYVDQSLVASATASAGGTWSAEATSALSAGDHEAYAIASLGGATVQTSKIELSTGTSSGLPFMEGFELGNLSQWTDYDNATVETGNPFSGVYAAHLTSTGGGSIAYLQKNFLSAQPEVYLSFRFKVLSKATTTVSIAKVRTYGSAGILAAYLSGGNYLGIRNEYLGISTTSSVPVSLNEWHQLEMRVRINGSAGEHEIWLDGQRVAAISGTQNLGTASIGRVFLGETITSRAHNTFFDDIAVDVSASTANRPPVALDDAYSLPQDGTLDVPAPGTMANDSDPENDLLDAALLFAPEHGDLELRPDGSFTYTPFAGFYGEDSFVYDVYDGEFESVPATVTLTVEPDVDVLFADGFETGDLSAWTKNFGLTVKAGAGIGASYAAQAKTSGAGTYAFKRLSESYDEVTLSFRCKIVSNGPNTTSIAKLRQRAGSGIVALYVTKNGKLGIRNETQELSITSSKPVTYGVWHDFKVRLLVDGANSELDVWMNGQHVAGISGVQDFGTTPFGRLIIGETVNNRAYEVLFDDILLTPGNNSPPFARVDRAAGGG